MARFLLQTPPSKERKGIECLSLTKCSVHIPLKVYISKSRNLIKEKKFGIQLNIAHKLLFDNSQLKFSPISNL